MAQDVPADQSTEPSGKEIAPDDLGRHRQRWRFVLAENKRCVERVPEFEARPGRERVDLHRPARQQVQLGNVVPVDRLYVRRTKGDSLERRGFPLHFESQNPRISSQLLSPFLAQRPPSTGEKRGQAPVADSRSRSPFPAEEHSGSPLSPVWQFGLPELASDCPHPVPVADAETKAPALKDGDSFAGTSGGSIVLFRPR